MPGCIVSATTASFKSMENRRRRATPVITSTFENVSDIGVCLGLSLGPPANAGVRSKQGALQHLTREHMAKHTFAQRATDHSRSPVRSVLPLAPRRIRERISTVKADQKARKR